MGKGYLLDTNTIIDFFGDKFPDKPKAALSKIIDDEINISVINKIELLSFTKLEKDFLDFVDSSNVYHLNDSIINSTIKIRRKYKTKLPDAIIAATAQYFNFVIITNNTKDFKNIKGLNVINPFKDL